MAEGKGPVPPRRGTRLALIVDDEEDIREFLTVTVQLEGFVAHAVPSGPEAIDYLAEDRPDLLIIDQMMPGLTGLEAVTKLRADGFTVPIILFSAYMDGKLRRACKRLDVQPVSKVDLEALRRVVRAVARGGRG